MNATKIKENLARITGRVARAAERRGRPPESVRLLAVTKSAGPREVEVLYEAGQRRFGENRVIEAIRRLEGIVAALPDSRWHMIGHLQRNKVRKALDFFHEVDSVDSARLLTEIESELERRGIDSFPILAEVNVSGEAAKTGMKPEELEPFLVEASRMKRARVLGLMTMAPLTDDPEKTRPVFAGLRELMDKANAKGWYRERLTELSMGMSGDFEVAVEEGATWVRIGTALFEGA
ncbi:MAG: YggS family pyridoxal phosphate-dependent enzyme [Planctomycetota bacterium]|nr:YggS family pyridoxal phosphate-dependent enzyme [Planctomycetota bacterium]